MYLEVLSTFSVIFYETCPLLPPHNYLLLFLKKNYQAELQKLQNSLFSGAQHAVVTTVQYCKDDI